MESESLQCQYNYYREQSRVDLLNTFSFCSSHTLSKVRELTERLQPPELMPSPLAKLASPCRPAPASIKDILVSGLTERGTGKDWEHFARGLGSDRQKEEYDRIRVREGK